MQLANERGYANAYGPFLERPARTFTQGAFGPFSPILPVPVDEPPPGAEQPDPRRFEFSVGWNLPVGQPGSEGLKLASFATLRSLADIYSVARTCIQRRKNEVAGLDWDIVPTHEASKAYQGDHAAMRDFGERRAKAVKFFRRPDPNYFAFSSWLKALLEEIFVFDALSLLLRPKRGRGLGRGVLGSDLDCLWLCNGPTFRPLLDLHGGTPRPPAPAYQQYLYGVPRSDFMTMVDEQDIRAAGMEGDRLGKFTTGQLLYLPLDQRTWTPYGFPATEQALIVIMTALQKQAYQLDYYREGTVPAVYISPGDANITPNQIRELQDALNAYAGDPAWHHKIIVLPPGAKVQPQRAQDLADQFDEWVANAVAMVYDVDPMSLGIIPKVATVASPFAAREMAQASRTVHERTSTKPLLKFLCDVFNAILHRVCGQDDMKFTFAGLNEAQDQAATTDLLVKQVQNGIRSVDEARGELELPPWGLPETSGPVVFTQMGPMPFEWMPGAALQGNGPYGQQGSAAGNAEAQGQAQGAAPGKPTGVHHPPSSRPVGTHNPRLGLPSGSNLHAEVPPERAGRQTGRTPAHSAAEAHVGSSRLRGGRAKAAHAELEALARHLRKGRDIATWRPLHIPAVTLAVVAEDLTKGLTPEQAVKNAVITLPEGSWSRHDEPVVKAGPKDWPGWRFDLELTGVYTAKVAAAFGKALRKAAALIRRWWAGALTVTRQELARLISSLILKALARVLRKLWREAWHLGSRSAQAVLRAVEADFGGWKPGDGRTLGTAYPRDLEAWIASHGRDALERMAWTRMDALADAIAEAAAAGEDPAALIARLERLLQAQARAALIAESEVQAAQGAGAWDVYLHAGVATKQWFTENDGKVCAICLANARQGAIPLNEPFQDGSMTTPAHGRCRCWLGPGDDEALKIARRVGLNGQEYWPADSYQSGTAPGQGALGAPVPHDGEGGYRPGGVPGATAGGEPPRWNGGEPEPRTATAPEDADDADWPRERERNAEPGAYWPATYMDGYWPQGGHGTGQPPGMPVPGEGRVGRPPNAVGKDARGYSLNPRSGMISLDLPEGAITPVPGGITDHHITVVYLGPDVDDEAFAAACDRAQRAASATPGPLVGVVSGTGSFPPSASSDGKVPAWAGVMLPGAGTVREALADLSASEHGDWHPHVTLAYVEPGEPLPGPVPATPVTFTHLSVHRGDSEVRRFPFGAPARVTKDAADLTDANEAEAEHVMNQMRVNYPEKAIGWMRDARWIGPVEVPHDRVDYGDEESWAASHQPDAVTRFAAHIKAGTGHTHPVVMVQKPGENKVEIVDGHHRTLAYRKLGRKVKAYIGFVPRDEGPWDETHSFQVHQGTDPANKNAKVSKESVNYREMQEGSRRCGNCVMYRPDAPDFGSGSCTLVAGPIRARAVCDRWEPKDAEKSTKPPVAAGLAVRAADTGRILMLQRAIAEEKDPAAGFWEMPGGCLDDGEDAYDAARREWAEETGCALPDGDLTGVWNASNGKYRGFVLTVPSEDAVPIFGDRDQVSNPDDPDRDAIEALAWWEPKQLRDNPAVRPELAEDLKRVRRALKSAQTPVVSTVHHPLGREGLWHTPDRHVSSMQQLPAYVQNTARALMRDQGMGEQEAIATAINAVKEWAAGRAFGGRVKVTPEVQAAARRALDEWQRLRASHH